MKCKLILTLVAVLLSVTNVGFAQNSKQRVSVSGVVHDEAICWWVLLYW